MSCAGETPLKYSFCGGHEPVAVIISQDDSQNEDAGKHITYTNIGTVAPGVCHVSENRDQSQYEVVMEHRTVGPVTESFNALLPLHEEVRCGNGSAASSPFYQYVPSKVRTPLQ